MDWLSQILYLLLVPTDHLLARLEQAVDFSFIDELCAPYYKWQPGGRGRPPWPVQLMFLYGVPYETMLVADLQVNIAWRWFVGLGLLEEMPDHSTLYAFCKRLGPQVLVQILARLLLLGLECGLIGNVDLYFDFTVVYASAVPFTPYQRALLLALAPNRYLDLAVTTEAPPTDRKGLLGLARRLLAVLPQARGDLDARLGKVNNWEFCFGYLAGYVIDGLFGLITAVVLATANAWQAALFPSALHQHRVHVPGPAERRMARSHTRARNVPLVVCRSSVWGRRRRKGAPSPCTPPIIGAGRRTASSTGARSTSKRRSAACRGRTSSVTGTPTTTATRLPTAAGR